MKTLNIAILYFIICFSIHAQTIISYPQVDTVFMEYKNIPMVIPHVIESQTGPDTIMINPGDSTKFYTKTNTKNYHPRIFFTVNDSLNKFSYQLDQVADPGRPWWPSVALYFDTPKNTLTMGFWLGLEIYDSNENFVTGSRRYIMPGLLNMETRIVKHNRVPSSTTLLSNYPNPFNNRTCIVYRTFQNSYIELAIYDQTGRQAEILYKGFQKQGIYELDWNAKQNSSGIYFLMIKSEFGIATHKLLYLK